MNGITLNKQLWTLMCLFVAGLLVVAACEAVISRLSLYDARRLALIHEGETATSVVLRWKGMAQAGSISIDDAKRNAVAELRAMRYGSDKSGYFSICDSKAVRVLAPNPSLEGTSGADVVDANGKHISPEIIRSDSPSGDHFTVYQFPHPGQTKPVDKLVYSSYVSDWDWHIFTGDYVDDVDKVFINELLKGFLAAAVVGGVLGVAMHVVINKVRRSIGGEPMVASEVARSVAAGNLTIEVPLMAGDKTSLMASLFEMRARLSEIVQEIRISALAIGTAAGEVAQGSDDLSQRTEQQAAALQETAASMDQLAAAVQHNSEATEKVNRLAADATLVARTGGKSIEHAVATMNMISESSAQITSIIAVIESIAFQTNILALNAAVEAARAGDEGRGFAVVAGEVRSLAQRSASAAREIKELISRSVERSNAGEETVCETGKAIVDVVGAVDRVSAIMVDITSSTAQQSFGIKQINQAVKQMDDVTQQNAALVEQAASSAQALAEQAKELIRAVSVFRTA